MYKLRGLLISLPFISSSLIKLNTFTKLKDIYC